MNTIHLATTFVDAFNFFSQIWINVQICRAAKAHQFDICIQTLQKNIILSIEIQMKSIENCSMFIYIFILFYKFNAIFIN